MNCKGSKCKKGTEFCCHECDKFNKCKDKWKCDDRKHYKDCLRYYGLSPERN